MSSIDQFGESCMHDDDTSLDMDANDESLLDIILQQQEEMDAELRDTAKMISSSSFEVRKFNRFSGDSDIDPVSVWKVDLSSALGKGSSSGLQHHSSLASIDIDSHSIAQKSVSSGANSTTSSSCPTISFRSRWHCRPQRSLSPDQSSVEHPVSFIPALSNDPSNCHIDRNGFKRHSMLIGSPTLPSRFGEGYIDTLLERAETALRLSAAPVFVSSSTLVAFHRHILESVRPPLPFLLFRKSRSKVSTPRSSSPRFNRMKNTSSSHLSSQDGRIELSAPSCSTAGNDTTPSSNSLPHTFPYPTVRSNPHLPRRFSPRAQKDWSPKRSSVGLAGFGVTSGEFFSHARKSSPLPSEYAILDQT